MLLAARWAVAGGSSPGRRGDREGLARQAPGPRPRSMTRQGDVLGAAQHVSSAPGPSARRRGGGPPPTQDLRR